MATQPDVKTESDDPQMVERRAIAIFASAMSDMGCCPEDIARFHANPRDGDDGIALEAIERALNEASYHAELVEALRELSTHVKVGDLFHAQYIVDDRVKPLLSKLDWGK